MSTGASTHPSFSRRRKLTIVFHLVLVLAAALAIVAMINYLSSHHYRRLHLSSHTQMALSPRTIGLLEGLTNRVHVTLYYDKTDELYSSIADLLKEYQAHNSKIIITTVDYYKEPGLAAEIKERYHTYLGSSTNKDFVIFDSGGRVKVVNGGTLKETRLVRADSPELVLDRKLVGFNGEIQFTAALLAISNPKPLNAYFLQGHKEMPLADKEDMNGAYAFTEVLRRNYVEPRVLDNLLGTNAVPDDCHLLIIAGPRDALLPMELEKIEKYLDQGGRLLALFNAYSQSEPTGLERMLAKWGVSVSQDIVSDLDNSITGQDMIVADMTRHPITAPFETARLHMIFPRHISAIEPPAQEIADLPQVVELVRASPKARIRGQETNAPNAYPLIVAVEKAPVKGVVSERGATRMVIVGDSFIFGNQLIPSASNSDFADSAVNWLLNRTVLLEGVGPQRVTEYRLVMTKGQMQAVRWILLGGMPGAILLLGGMIWFGRRK